MNIRRTLKYAAIVISILVIGLAALVASDPKWCYCEHLRHSFDKRVLVTPVNRITDEESETLSWGVEYSKFSDKLYKNAYLMAENRRVTNIYPYAYPALTVGFYIGVVIDSPDDNIKVELNEALTRISIADEPDTEFDIASSGRSISLNDGHRGKYFKYRLALHVENETIERLSIEDGDLFSGAFQFIVDGEPYSFDFSSTLRNERRKRSCFGIPGTP